jgi:glycosyltransferase involved in cell wall biosynthesis
MKKNVLYICPSSGLGGAETFLKNTFLDHNSKDFCPVYLLFRPGPLETWLRENGANVEILPFIPRLLNPWSIFKTHLFIKKLIKSRDIEIIHSTMAYGALFAAMAAKQSRKIHLWFQHGPASGWMDQLAALLPHKAVLVNSDYTLKTQKELERPYKFLISKHRIIQRIDLGTQPFNKLNEKISLVRKELIEKFQLPVDVTLFGMACRLQRWKGIDLVIEAARTSWLTNKKFFVFIWGDIFDSAEYLTDLKRKSIELPLSFEGACQDVPLAFAACDVIINASMQPEPFGLTIIEAFSAGKTVIAPREGGPLEIINDEKTGLLFDPRNANSLSEKINLLTHNKEKRELYQQNARNIFNQKYNSQKMVKELEDFYRILISTDPQ